MEKILRLLWVFNVTSMLFLYRHSINVEGRHQISKKTKSKVVSYAPSPIEGSVNESLPPPSLSPASSHSDVIPWDPNYGGNSDLSPDDSHIFDAMEYGAVGDGSMDDTDAFIAAWKAACQVESAVLFAPANRTFMITSTIFSGPCKPGLEFRVNGVLMPPEGPDFWPKEDSKMEWIVFYKVDNMTFSGTGTIEGNGEKWWELPCKPHKGPNGSTLPGPCDSPSMIKFFRSSNLVVRGLRIQNSPKFHVKFDGCERVLIDQLSISSPELSPNTDGIHIDDTKSVGIYNSVIASGDDCISIGPDSSNIVIQAVTCGPSHGISIGSLGEDNSQACVSNITVQNAIIRDSDNGVRIKTWQGGSGSVTGLLFDTIKMENVRKCIIIDQYYCNTKGCRNETSAVRVHDISYRSIKGTYDLRSAPIHFACSDTIACTNITMSEVELLPHEGELVDNPFCWNAYGIQQTLTIPPIDCLQDGMPQEIGEAVEYSCSA